MYNQAFSFNLIYVFEQSQTRDKTIERNNEGDGAHRNRSGSYGVEEDGLSWDVEDPYDPLKPNDYMKILEERKARRRQRALAKDNERYMKELDRERNEIVKERDNAVKEGTVSIAIILIVSLVV